MVLAAAGAVDHDTIVAQAEVAFGALSRANPESPETALYCGGIKRSDRSFEQSHIVMSFEGPSYRDDDMYTGQILSSILGGGMSSRLFQQAREARGLCYSIYSYCWGLSDTGLIGIHAATGADQMLELVGVILNELENLASTTVGSGELERAKAQLKSGLLMSLESSGSRAEQLARQTLVFGAPLEIDSLIEKVEAVDKEAVRELAARTIVARNPSVATVGPLADPRALEELIQGQYPSPARAAE
jgi:predicted Zn-dependent peptidase